jgi:hypothetical protein
MPHDANGVLLEVGDRVVLRGKVKSIDSEQETYCNITFEADRKMAPTPESQPWGTVLSARMVEKEVSS